MNWIVVEEFNGNISLLLDEEGQTALFDTQREAQVALKRLQGGFVFPLMDVTPILEMAARL